MSSEKWSFDQEAASWDKNPGRVQLTHDIAAAISGEGILTPESDLLDFGCGTGLLTLRLQPLVRSVTGVDSSKGMLAVLDSKIEKERLTTVKTRYVSLERGDSLEGRYDVVVCSMTLHHVKEIGPLLEQFRKVMAPGGYLVLADLEPEGGEFHGENDTVFHCGFDRAVLRQTVRAAGFEDIRDRMAATVAKPGSDGTMRSFDVFLMTGRKSA